MSQLVQLEGKHSTQNAHCAVGVQVQEVEPVISPDMRKIPLEP